MDKGQIGAARPAPASPYGHFSHQIIGLQYLRALAAMMVVCFHITLQLKFLGFGSAIKTLQSGVDIFFVLSGFVMIYSTRCGERTNGASFLLNRLTRIGPLYWLSTIFMIVVLLVSPAIVKTSKLELGHAVASLFFIPWPHPVARSTMVPLVTPGWTLNLEIFFYAVLGLAMVFRIRGKQLVAATATFLFLLGVVGLLYEWTGWLSFYSNSIIWEFAYGMVIALVYLRPGQRPMKALIATSMALAGFALLLIPSQGDIAFRGLRYGIPSTIIVIAFLSLNKEHRVLRLLGDASYSLYITHFFVLSLVTQLWMRLHLFAHPVSRLAFFPVSLALCVGVSLLCYAVVESRLTQIARKGMRKLGRTAEPASSIFEPSIGETPITVAKA